MADIKTKYGTANQAITITLNSLAASTTVGRQSTVVDNTSNLYVDALLQVTITMANTATTGAETIFVYGYGTADGTTYTGQPAASGSDATHTLVDARLHPFPLIGRIATITQNIAYVGGPWSVAAAFGGVLPAKWGILVVNDNGAAAIHSSGNAAVYQGIQLQTV